jgi:hypothetical protein
MKKITTLVAITLLALTSCSKEETTITPSVPHKAAFGGTISPNGKVTINGKECKLNEIYDVKVGDVLKFTDPGIDIVHPDEWMYPSNGNPPYLAWQGYTEHGFTYGVIIVDAWTVKTSTPPDVNLTYTVK